MCGPFSSQRDLDSPEPQPDASTTTAAAQLASKVVSALDSASQARVASPPASKSSNMFKTFTAAKPQAAGAGGRAAPSSSSAAEGVLEDTFGPIPQVPKILLYHRYPSRS